MSICLVFVILLCASCGQTLPEDYRESAFCAELSYEVKGVKTVCVIEYGAPSEGARRDFLLSFIAPEELSTFEIVRRDGEYILVCGEEKIPCRGMACEALAKVALLLSLEGERSYKGSGVDGDELRLYWSVSTESGNVALVTDANGVPISLTLGDTYVNVTHFEDAVTFS